MGEVPEVRGNPFIGEMPKMTVELIGIVATLFVLVSFLMKDAARIRKVNIVGAFLFVVYGLLINSISVWLLNAILMIVHIKFLTQKM